MDNLANGVGAKLAKPIETPLPACGLAFDFAEMYDGYTEVPSSFLYMGYLTLLGAAVSKSTTFDDGQQTEPRLYTLLLGESNATRKSTALRLCVNFFNKLDEFKTQAAFCHGVGSGEGLAKFLMQNRNTILILDEFKALVDKGKIESSSLLPHISTLFENHEVENITKTQTTIIRGANLSLLGASTTGTYETIFSQDFMNMGFPNRVWLCVDSSDGSIPFTKQVDPMVYAKLQRDTNRVIEIYNKCHSLSFASKAADAAWSEWYHQRPKTDSGRRLEGYGLRLMVVLTVSKQEKSISLETAQEVIKLLEHQHQIRELYDPINSDQVIGRLEEKIRRVLRSASPLSMGDLKHRCHAERQGVGNFLRALDNLVDVGEVGFDTIQNQSPNKSQMKLKIYRLL